MTIDDQFINPVNIFNTPLLNPILDGDMKGGTSFDITGTHSWSADIGFDNSVIPQIGPR